jgi:hypothetical protein
VRTDRLRACAAVPRTTTWPRKLKSLVLQVPTHRDPNSLAATQPAACRCSVCEHSHLRPSGNLSLSGEWVTCRTARLDSANRRPPFLRFLKSAGKKTSRGGGGDELLVLADGLLSKRLNTRGICVKHTDRA